MRFDNGVESHGKSSSRLRFLLKNKKLTNQSFFVLSYQLHFSTKTINSRSLLTLCMHVCMCDMLFIHTKVAVMVYQAFLVYIINLPCSQKSSHFDVIPLGSLTFSIYSLILGISSRMTMMFVCVCVVGIGRAANLFFNGRLATKNALAAYFQIVININQKVSIIYNFLKFRSKIQKMCAPFLLESCRFY